jgi:prolyl oligopeptidase
MTDEHSEMPGKAPASGGPDRAISAQVDEDDRYLWLEDLTDSAALDWVKARNLETVTELTGDDGFDRMCAELLEVLDSTERIPYVRRRGDYLYNFWRDAANPKGLWRRTTLDEYIKDSPQWEVLLDVDALASQEGANWVWQGAVVHRPGHHRALVMLSRGGADACVIREFDVDSHTFVPDGFQLPEAKSSVGWINTDTIYVGTEFEPDSLTNSGYPRIVKQWRRGTPLSDATVVYEGKRDDVAVRGFHDPTEGFERDFVRRDLDFYRSELFLRDAGGELTKLDIPEDATADPHRSWLLIRTRSAWTAGANTYPAGALLAIGFDDFLTGDRTFTVLFDPDPHTSLRYHVWTRDHLIISTLHDVQTRMHVLTPRPDGWQRAPLPGIGEHSTADIIDTDPDNSDEYFLDVSGFTEPTTLHHGRIGDQPTTVKQQPTFFDSADVTVQQHFATSADGTSVPYFVVGKAESGAPTLLTGYGGFEISLTPSYSGVVGRGWLARGGTYVVANIRGGGEYGPSWHHAALRADRTKAYEDFAAVAEDLVARGITTPRRLGVQGGSNGGLLTGVMLTRYPDRFGAVVSQVPLLDMKRYHRLLAGASWVAEYGNPDEDADWAFLKKYSPYHNVRPGQSYPPLLLVTSTRDDRVHPGHARKMAALMCELGHDVRYYENIEGGHGAAADNYQLAYKSSLIYTFLWQTLTGN